MKNTLPGIGLAAGCAWLLFGSSGMVQAAAPAPKAIRGPNILLIVSDDQGYPDLGCIGSKPILTPALDRLAAEGVRATSFYVTWPACTPSRGSLLTGRYPQRNGLYDMIRNDMVNYGHRFTAEEYAVSPEMTLGLDVREQTVGDVLKRAGYRTGVVGKWDMGQAQRFLPLQRGFDFFYGHGNNGIDYYTHERYGVPSMFSRQRAHRSRQGNLRHRPVQARGAAIHPRERRSPVVSLPRLQCPARRAHPSRREPGEKKASEGVQAPEKYVALYRGKVANEKLREILRRGNVHGRGHRRNSDACSRTTDSTTNTLVLFFSDNGGSGNGGNAPLTGRRPRCGRAVCASRSSPGGRSACPAGKVTDEFLTALEMFPTFAGVGGRNPAAGRKTRRLRHAAGPARRNTITAHGDVLAAPRRQGRTRRPVEMGPIRERRRIV